jgi:hypothetical protein
VVKQQAAAYRSSSAVRRLMRDIKEIMDNPLEDVWVAPLENDIFTWHGNFISRKVAFHGRIFHFELTFDKTFVSICYFSLFVHTTLFLSFTCHECLCFISIRPGFLNFD